MGSNYKPGTWNVICQVCGVQFKSDEVRKRWDGFIVCNHDYETRHILDFARVPAERSSVPYTSPEPADVFIELAADIFSTQGKADIGKADVAKADFILTII